MNDFLEIKIDINLLIKHFLECYIVVSKEQILELHKDCSNFIIHWYADGCKRENIANYIVKLINKEFQTSLYWPNYSDSKENKNLFYNYLKKLCDKKSFKYINIA